MEPKQLFLKRNNGMVKMFCFRLIMVAKTIHIKIIEYVANFFTKRDFSIILPCSNMLKLS